MADLDQNQNEKNILPQESIPKPPEQRGEEEVQNPEQSPLEKEVVQDVERHQEIRSKIDQLEIDDSLKVQAQGHADDIKDADDKEKVKQLLLIAKKKGVVLAVHVAKKMGDPFLLDSLHDALAREGYYKNFY